MSSKTTLIADLEKLLAAAKSANLETMDNATRMDLLSQVEEVHHQLDDPLLAMYRHLVNVCPNLSLSKIGPDWKLTNVTTVHDNIGSPNYPLDGGTSSYLTRCDNPYEIKGYS